MRSGLSHNREDQLGDLQTVGVELADCSAESRQRFPFRSSLIQVLIGVGSFRWHMRGETSQRVVYREIDGAIHVR